MDVISEIANQMQGREKENFDNLLDFEMDYQSKFYCKHLHLTINSKWESDGLHCKAQAPSATIGGSKNLISLADVERLCSVKCHECPMFEMPEDDSVLDCHKEDNEYYGDDEDDEYSLDTTSQDTYHDMYESIYKKETDYDYTDFGDYDKIRKAMESEFPLEHKQNQVIYALKQSGNCYAKHITYFTYKELKLAKEGIQNESE